MKKLISSLTFTAAILLTSVAAHADNYKVHRGDTLSAIGARYGVCYKAIMKANNLKCTTIHPGQVLYIPSRSMAYNAPAPKPNYGYSKPAPKPVYNNTYSSNSYSKPTCNRSSSNSYSSSYANNGSTHRVRRGENLGVIAERYNISTRHLLKANNLRSTTIYVGQTLTIPKKPSRYSFASY